MGVEPTQQASPSHEADPGWSDVIPLVLLKVWRLMAAVAAVGVLIGAVSVYDAAGIAYSVIGGCIVVLTCKLASEDLATRREDGVKTSRLKAAWVVLRSAAFAALIIGGSDLAFFLSFYMYMVCVDLNPWYPGVFDSYPHHLLGSLACGSLLALALVRTASTSPRRWLWVVGLCVSLILWPGLSIMQERVRYCSLKIADNARQEQDATRPESAALGRARREWYSHVMWRPWISVDPPREVQLSWPVPSDKLERPFKP